MATEENINNKNSSHKEFSKMLESDFKDRKLKEGEIVKAKIVEINKNYVIADLRLKMEAMIPVDEFKANNELEKIKVNDIIECFLERVESAKGELIVSYSKAKRMKTWKKLVKIFESGEEIEGRLTGRIKGGFVAEIDGLSCFVPSSQLDSRPLKKVDHLMGIPLKFVAVRLDRERGNVALSRRAVLEKNRNAEIKELLKQVSEGDIVTAECKGITEFGVFFNYKGLDMLCHIKQLSHGRVKSPTDLVNVGDKIKVKITEINETTSRVNCSIKELTESPFANIEKNFKVGEIYKGVVQKVLSYGAFIRLAEGVEGLCHQSCLDWGNKNIEPNKVLSPSQEISVKVISIEPESKRISLSYKDTMPSPWKEIEKKLDQPIDAVVKNVTDKAIFAEISSGLTGMIHYREINYNSNSDDLKKYKKGDKIKAKVIEIKDEKLKLSIKRMEKDPFEFFNEKKYKVGSIISTKVVEVMKTGVKVAVDPEKKIIVTVKKSNLAKEPADCRPEIFSPGNTLPDAKITELSVPERKVTLSVRAAQIQEEKNLVQKFGEGAAKSGRSLAGIFSAALGRKKKTKKKE